MNTIWTRQHALIFPPA